MVYKISHNIPAMSNNSQPNGVQFHYKPPNRPPLVSKQMRLRSRPHQSLQADYPKPQLPLTQTPQNLCLKAKSSKPLNLFQLLEMLLLRNQQRRRLLPQWPQLRRKNQNSKSKTIQLTEIPRNSSSYTYLIH